MLKGGIGWTKLKFVAFVKKKNLSIPLARIKIKKMGLD